jgi:hypothetical protein
MKEVLADLDKGKFVRTQVIGKNVIQREDNINNINIGETI